MHQSKGLILPIDKTIPKYLHVTVLGENPKSQHVTWESRISEWHNIHDEMPNHNDFATVSDCGRSDMPMHNFSSGTFMFLIPVDKPMF